MTPPADPRVEQIMARHQMLGPFAGGATGCICQNGVLRGWPCDAAVLLAMRDEKR